MRNSTPIAELDIQELNNILKELQEKLTKNLSDNIEYMRNENIKYLDRHSLDCIANNGYYEPYNFDLGYIIERLKKDSSMDTNEESLCIKIDLSEQISKMKNIPPFDTECHIESNNEKKCTSFWNFILKNFLGQKKYRLVFHNNKMDYSKTYYETKRIPFDKFLVYSEIFIFLFSILSSNVLLSVIDIFAIICTLTCMTLIKYFS